jgi:hypothetical protein
LISLCTLSVIVFACVNLVVTYSWFGFNAIIVTHLFELTFELAVIVSDNILRLRVTCQPGVMKQILDGFTDLFVASTISNKLISGYIA